MKLDVKEYFKLSIIYTLIAAVAPALQLLIQPIIEGEGRLSPVDFSHLAISESITAIVFIFVALSMGIAVARFYYDYKDEEKDFKVMVSTAFNSILLRGALVLGIGLVAGDFVVSFLQQKELQDFATYGYAAIIIGISRAINNTAAALYRNEKKVSKFVVVSLAFGLVRIAGQVIGLFYYDMSFLGYVYGSCVGGGVVSVCVLAHTWYQNGFKYNRKFLKPMIKFGLPITQYGLVSWGLLFADRYFLESQPRDLGIYDTALRFAAGIEMILLGLHGANQPEMFRMMKEGIKENMDNLRRASNIFLAQTQVIVACAILPTMFYLDYFYETDVRLAYTLIAIVFIRFIMRAQYLIFATPVYFKKKTRVFFYINLASLLMNLGLNYWLIPLYNIYGAIIATMASSMLLTTLVYYYQNREVPIKWNVQKLYVFPNLIMLYTIGMEWAKTYWNINQYLAAGSVVFVIGTSIIILYRKEIMGFKWSKFKKGMK